MVPNPLHLFTAELLQKRLYVVRIKVKDSPLYFSLVNLTIDVKCFGFYSKTVSGVISIDVIVNFELEFIQWAICM